MKVQMSKFAPAFLLLSVAAATATPGLATQKQ
jgi:hypothetical protein